MTNNISHLKDIGIGKRIFLVGNGPSLNDMNLDLLKNEISIGMNRISMIYHKTLWRPTYYIFSSNNCTHNKWGVDWSKSVVEASNEPKTTPIIWQRFKGNIESKAGALNERTIFINSVTEHKVGSEKAFSEDAEKVVDKSGTTMNIALQLAFYMNFDETYIIGCDSNWQTTNSNNGDPNHFDDKYKASIANGKHEFNRMNTTHKRAKKSFDSKGNKIFNAGLNSAIDVYPRVDYNSLF